MAFPGCTPGPCQCLPVKYQAGMLAAPEELNKPEGWQVGRSTFWAALLSCGVTVLGGCVSGGAGERVRPDLIIGDFDGELPVGWDATGTAFANPTATGRDLVVLEIEDADGGVATSEHEGDGPQGTLTSPEFVIERDYISFRIAGGDYERSTCLDLVVDGNVVKSATGWWSDHLSPQSWNVRAWKGRRARLVLVDLASGGWGHINVDNIRQTDEPERMPLDKTPLYQESHRPRFHFTARQWTMDRLNPGMRQEGWINDLNGLIRFNGEYHLFAQRWAKCWLHAVSTDLMHWTELEPAFWEESEGSGVQSGSCVIDYANTSGLSPDGGKTVPMIAFWSRFDNRSQCMSYSLDSGRTWRAYEGNPIFDRVERDPKVFWYEGDPATKGHWVMAMYGQGQYHILTSDNLLDWTDEHNPIPDCFECPDLFELPVQGSGSERKWVLVQGNGMYSVGTFDGKAFREESGRIACDIGPSFYATQSWANMDGKSGPGGRRIQAAWMRGGVYPDMPFNQQVTFPCELTLRDTPEGIRLFREPIKEIAELLGTEESWGSRTLGDGQELRLAPSGREFRIVADVRVAEGARLVVNVRGARVVLTKDTLESGGATGSVQDEVKHIEMLVDRASIETFVNQGELSSSRCDVMTGNGLSLRAEGGAVEIESVRLWAVESIWTDQGVSNLR